ncbi:MAG: hypothetical protein U0R71_04770 [Solirubrobacterales bacterium]
MAGTRGGLGRIVAMALGLALLLALVAAGAARAGRYAVVQCGWFAGADAEWADTTGGAKFRSDGWCVPPAGADPFDGVHLKSLTRDGAATVSGTRFARWRWVAPPGTGITQVRGTWWHALHDGLEQRLGVGTPAGGFDVFAAAGATDTVPREFVAGFPTPMPAFEDRLLCARAESRSCSLEAGSWSALRALTITLEDPLGPSVAVGGEITLGGWRRGVQGLGFVASDVGAGIDFGVLTLDGAQVAINFLDCAKALVGGEWRATAMRPCPLTALQGASVATTAFSDGPHRVGACAFDFAGNPSCGVERTVLIDNTAPAHPRAVALAGGDGWRRINDFDLGWANPDQGPASPIDAAVWRLTGPGGFDSGVQLAAGRDRTTLENLAVPAAGPYVLRLWLRDEAGNEAPGAAVEVPLRLDDAGPALAFAAGSGTAVPERLQVEVADPLSGPAAGQISYRRAEQAGWTELATKLVDRGGGAASLTAPLPSLEPGTYLFQAEATDAAANRAATTLRGDGTRMAIQAPAPPPPRPAAKTRLFARLSATGRRASGRAAGGGASAGDVLTVPFGAAATLAGRLTWADGAAIAGREVRVVSHPSRGSLAAPGVLTALTGPRGGFELELAPGPSRRLTASFPGAEGMAEASREGLVLRVRSGVELRASPRSLRTGETLRMRGRVIPGQAPIPRRGKLVAIQYREAATGRWRPVLVTRTDHAGRFRAHYRFRYVSGRSEIRLRATALGEESWPYAPGSSRPLTVTVEDR